jgi:hypothetical protein
MTSRAKRHRNPLKPKPKLTVAAVFQNVDQRLEMTEQALSDVLGNDPTRRVTGLLNVAVWGRGVTRALQRLRTPLGKKAFDDWYTPYEAEMAADELMRYFYVLRSQVLKEAETPEVGTRLYVEELTGRDLQALMRDPPPGAKNFFIGDELGGAGWDVELPDGRIGQHYITLPGYLKLSMTLHLEGGPTTHGGATLTDTSIEALTTHYVAYLRRLVSKAKQTFGT